MSSSIRLYSPVTPVYIEKLCLRHKSGDNAIPRTVIAVLKHINREVLQHDHDRNNDESEFCTELYLRTDANLC